MASGFKRQYPSSILQARSRHANPRTRRESLQVLLNKAEKRITLRCSFPDSSVHVGTPNVVCTFPRSAFRDAFSVTCSLSDYGAAVAIGDRDGYRATRVQSPETPPASNHRRGRGLVRGGVSGGSFPTEAGRAIGRTQH